MIDIINWLFIRLMLTIIITGFICLSFQLIPIIESEKIRAFIFGYIIGGMIIGVGMWFVW